MIGQLPAEFFIRFFEIFSFSKKESAEMEKEINLLCQRAFVQQQLLALPDRERETYSRLLEQAGISPATLSEFLEQQLDDELEHTLWQRGLLQVWREILNTIGRTATAEQKDRVRELLREYSEGEEAPGPFGDVKAV